jgi:hypothetical protein
MIHIIRLPATQQQIDEMMQSLETYIKLAVDIERDGWRRHACRL